MKKRPKIVIHKLDDHKQKKDHMTLNNLKLKNLNQDRLKINQKMI